MSPVQLSSSKMSAAFNSLLAIPAEIQLEIFSYLDEDDLQSALYPRRSLYVTARVYLILKNAQDSASALYWARFNGDLSLATKMPMLDASYETLTSHIEAYTAEGRQFIRLTSRRS
ncbi:hypothetical protein DL769_000017 [Monosporascus sp. CRB-8-3]|nr:hypothetical protein DL769_000017 [Monosporascus sp. CRB-8-3]